MRIIAWMDFGFVGELDGEVWKWVFPLVQDTILDPDQGLASNLAKMRQDMSEVLLARAIESIEEAVKPEIPVGNLITCLHVLVFSFQVLASDDRSGNS